MLVVPHMSSLATSLCTLPPLAPPPTRFHTLLVRKPIRARAPNTNSQACLEAVEAVQVSVLVRMQQVTQPLPPPPPQRLQTSLCAREQRPPRLCLHPPALLPGVRRRRQWEEAEGLWRCLWSGGQQKALVAAHGQCSPPLPHALRQQQLCHARPAKSAISPTLRPSMPSAVPHSMRA